MGTWRKAFGVIRFVFQSGTNCGWSVGLAPRICWLPPDGPAPTTEAWIWATNPWVAIFRCTLPTLQGILLPPGTHRLCHFFCLLWLHRFKVSKARGQLSTFLNITEHSGCSKYVSWLFCSLERVGGPPPQGRLGRFLDKLCRGLFVAVKRSFPSWEWASGLGNSRHLETCSCNKQAQSKLASQREASSPSCPGWISRLPRRRAQVLRKGP